MDAAIIARADAFQNPKTLEMFEIDDSWYSPEIVTVGVLKTSAQADKAKELAEFLSSPEAVKVFGKYGFLPAPQGPGSKE